jgi:RNA polymerase sigma-70 factor (ECF subfamily)
VWSPVDTPAVHRGRDDDRRPLDDSPERPSIMRAIRQLPPAGPSAAPPPPAGALESGPTRHLAHAIAVLRGHDAARPLEAHEAAALAVLYRAYAAMLLTVARRLMRCDAEAEDVVHDVFCRLPQVVAQYRDGGFGGWLKQMTVRTALMRLRAARRRSECGVRGDEAWTAPVRADFDALGRDDELRAVLGRLPESLRQVVVLRVFLDYSHTEIAETLDITDTASQVRLCRGLKQLRALLRRDVGGAPARCA